jgi:hypothetical protein
MWDLKEVRLIPLQKTISWNLALNTSVQKARRCLPKNSTVVELLSTVRHCLCFVPLKPPREIIAVQKILPVPESRKLCIVQQGAGVRCEHPANSQQLAAGRREVPSSSAMISLPGS